MYNVLPDYNQAEHVSTYFKNIKTNSVCKSVGVV